MVALFVLLPTQVQAEAPTQNAEPTPILLGERVQQAMQAGEIAIFSVTLPATTRYMVSTDNPLAEASFDLVIYDATGDVVFEDALLEMTDLELARGVYRLEITARAAAELSFFVIGQLGAMSDDAEEPGALFLGGFYQEDSVSEPRYATLSIPPLGEPRRVLIYIEAGEADVFTLGAEGADLGYRYINTEAADLLTFWTEGGDYQISVQPQERRSQFSLTVFLSDRVEALPLGQPLATGMADGDDMLVYAFVLDALYETVTVRLEGQSQESGIQLNVMERLSSPDRYYGSEQNGALVVEMLNQLPGIYYIVVTRFSDEGEAGYTLSVDGVAGEPLLRLAPGEAMTGDIGAGKRIYHIFDVSQPGALVTVELSSTVEGADFDLAIGRNLLSLPWDSVTPASAERVVFAAPVAGAYYVEVTAYSGAGAYTLTATEGAPASQLTPGTIITGSLESMDAAIYRLRIDEPGQMLTVLLVGDEDVDLDLFAILYGEDGAQTANWSSVNPGAGEIIAQAAAATGDYEISVRSYGDGGDYRLLARVAAAEEFLLAGNQ